MKANHIVEEESALDFLQDNPAPDEYLNTALLANGFAEVPQEAAKRMLRRAWLKKDAEHNALDIRVWYPNQGPVVDVAFTAVFPDSVCTGHRVDVPIAEVLPTVQTVESAIAQPDAPSMEQALKQAGFSYDVY